MLASQVINAILTLRTGYAGVTATRMRATTHWRLAGFACCIIGFWLTWLCLSEPKLYFKYTLLEALTFNKAAAARAGILGSRVFGGHRTWSTDAASKAIVIGKLSTEDTAWTSDLGTE